MNRLPSNMTLVYSNLNSKDENIGYSKKARIQLHLLSPIASVFDEYFTYDVNGEKLTPYRLFGDAALKKRYFYRGDIGSPIMSEQEVNLAQQRKRKYPFQGEQMTIAERRKRQKRVSFLQAQEDPSKEKLLICGHCKQQFRAKATYREQFGHHLVNHRCSGNERIQYVIGVKHRRCTFNCHPNVGCVNFAQ